MSYTLNSTALAAALPAAAVVDSVVVVDEDGNSVIDLLGHALVAHPNVTYGSADWRGTSRRWFQTTGSGFSGQGVSWTAAQGSRPLIPSAATGGNEGWAIYIFSGHGPSANDSGSGRSGPISSMSSRSAPSSISWHARVSTTASIGVTLGRYPSNVYESNSAGVGNAPSAYFCSWSNGGSCGSRQRTAAGTFGAFTSDPDTTGACPTDPELTHLGTDTESWFQWRFHAAIHGHGTKPSAAQADAIVDAWFDTLISVSSDTTPPTLTSPSGTGGLDVCTGSVSTNEAGGDLYAVATASATAPTQLQVRNGQDHTGAAALRVRSQAVTSTGAQSIPSGAISGGAGTRYWHFMHEDAAGNRSAVVSSAGFSVTASATQLVVTVPDAAGLSGFNAVVLSAAAPGAGVTVIATATGITFNGSGQATISIAGLGVPVTAYRWVSVTNATGDPLQSPAPVQAQGPVQAS